MKHSPRILALILAASIGFAFAGCESKNQETGSTEGTVTASENETVVYINQNAVTFAEEGATDLDMLSVENGITVSASVASGDTVTVNGEILNGDMTLDVYAITRTDTLEIGITDAEGTATNTVNLMPSTFPSYTAEGESTTEGDFYLTTYDLEHNYLFKLNNSGELIFYKAITKTTADGEEVNTNALDFRKQYTSDGEVRYTYMPYLEDAFAGDCSGINPGCVIVMDESYNVIDEIYYTDSDGEQITIDPHGFIWIDEGHYILTAYKEETVDVPADIETESTTADLAVLYINEIKDGEVLWEFCSKDYDKFLYESNTLNWDKAQTTCQDYMHFNSMSIDTDGNLLVSCRHLDSILKISRSTGELIWQLGGDYGDFELSDDQRFSYQHSIILTDDGQYMLFDNANTAVSGGSASYSSVIRMSVDEESTSVTDFVRYNVVDFYSIYMGAVREIDSLSKTYLWSVGGNYVTDSVTPPEWSMVEYTEDGEGNVTHTFKFRFDEGTRRLYCSNKCV